jgi:pyroglutamyl-peptidase
MRMLVSGFEPFGGESVNPSARVVERLAAAGLPTVVLPVVFARAWVRLAAAVDETEPDTVVALGQAGGATGIVVEQIAVNLDDPGTPDEEGAMPVDVPIVDGAPLAYRSGLDVRGVVEALRRRGIPAQHSRSAGGHLCNHVFFRLCHLAATARPGLRAAFVHLPYLPEQVTGRRAPSMPLDTQVAAVRTVLDAA